MKNKRIVEVLGSVILAVSLGITGCTVKIEDDKKTEKSEKETTEETTEETEDPCCCEVDECEISYCGSCVSFEDDYEFVSTNGELEGQLDYMELAPRCEDINWDAYPDDLTIDDLSVIEDEDMRNLAQECVDCGYVVDDPELDRIYAISLGDGEYQFTNGFSATYDNGNDFGTVYAYKMNEELFDYFLVQYNGFSNEDCTDDGTVIRYGSDSYYVEYNRETGIGMTFISCGGPAIAVG